MFGADYQSSKRRTVKTSILGSHCTAEHRGDGTHGAGERGWRAAIGIRRPKPKARDVTFNPGAACCRFYSLV